MLYNSNIVSIANKVSQAANILELYKVYICFKFTLFIFYFFWWLLMEISFVQKSKILI